MFLITHIFLYIHVRSHAENCNDLVIDRFIILVDTGGERKNGKSFLSLFVLYYHLFLTAIPASFFFFGTVIPTPICALL